MPFVMDLNISSSASDGAGGTYGGGRSLSDKVDKFQIKSVQGNS